RRQARGGSSLALFTPASAGKNGDENRFDWKETGGRAGTGYGALPPGRFHAVYRAAHLLAGRGHRLPLGSGADPVRQPVDPPADSSAGRADVSENLPSRGDPSRRRPGQSDDRRIRLRRRSAGLAAPPLALGGGMVAFADRWILCDHPRRKREESGGNDGDLQRFVPFGK